MRRNGVSGSTMVSPPSSPAGLIAMTSRFSSIARCNRNGPVTPEAGANWFCPRRSASAALRSLSISALRLTTVCSSSVISAIRCVASAMLAAEPKRQGERVRVEPLRLGEADRRRGDGGEARRVATDDRRALHEVENAEPGGEAGAARGRQDMVGARDVIANRLGRVAAEKDRAGMPHPGGQPLGFG